MLFFPRKIHIWSNVIVALRLHWFVHEMFAASSAAILFVYFRHSNPFFHSPRNTILSAFSFIVFFCTLARSLVYTILISLDKWNVQAKRRPAKNEGKTRHLITLATHSHIRLLYAQQAGKLSNVRVHAVSRTSNLKSQEKHKTQSFSLTKTINDFNSKQKKQNEKVEKFRTKRRKKRNRKFGYVITYYDCVARYSWQNATTMSSFDVWLCALCMLRIDQWNCWFCVITLCATAFPFRCGEQPAIYSYTHSSAIAQRPN